MKNKITVVILASDEGCSYRRDFHTQREALHWVMTCGLDERYLEWLLGDLPANTGFPAGWARCNAHRIELRVDDKFRKGWTSLPWNQIATPA